MMADNWYQKTYQGTNRIESKKRKREKEEIDRWDQGTQPSRRPSLHRPARPTMEMELTNTNKHISIELGVSLVGLEEEHVDCSHLLFH